MRSLIRSCVVVLVGLGVTSGALLAWSFASKQSFQQTIAEPFSMLMFEWNKGAELDDRSEALLHRALLKTEIVERLLREEITFLEAVELFSEATEQTRVSSVDEGWEDLESSEFPQSARCLLQWLQQELREHPQREALLKKYRREYRQVQQGV